MKYLYKAVKEAGGKSISGYNDEEGRTHEQIMEVMSRAIALCEASEIK